MTALCSTSAAAVSLLGATDMQSLGISNTVALAIPSSSNRRSANARITAAVSFSTVACPWTHIDGRRKIVVSKAAGAQVSEEEPSATAEEVRGTSGAA